MAPTPQACLEQYFKALHDCDGDAFDDMFHPRGTAVGLGPDGSVVCQDCSAFRASALSRGSSAELGWKGEILALRVLADSLCSAKVRSSLPRTSTSTTSGESASTAFVAIAREGEASWRIVSQVSASAARSQRVVPADFDACCRTAWDGYVSAARACDGDKAALAFHPDGAAVDIEGGTTCDVRWRCASEVYDRVSARWRSPRHRDYAHLRRACSEADDLESVDVASDSAAAVTLKVGFPPRLFTEVLFLLRLPRAPAHRSDARPGWWIVAKAAVSTQFREDDAPRRDAERTAQLQRRAAALLAKCGPAPDPIDLPDPPADPLRGGGSSVVPPRPPPR